MGTDLSDRKNKRQLCRVPCAARFPSLQGSRGAVPNLTPARMRATSRRAGMLRNLCQARTISPPRAQREAGRPDRALHCWNCPFGLSVNGLRAAVAVSAVVLSKLLIKALSRSQCSQWRSLIPPRELPRQFASADFAALVCRNCVDDKDPFRDLPSAQRIAAKT